MIVSRTGSDRGALAFVAAQDRKGPTILGIKPVYGDLGLATEPIDSRD
jgi:hypothetical protein